MKRVVPGVHSVREVFKVRPKEVSELWLREGDLNAELEEIHVQAKRFRVKLKRVSQKSLDREVTSHQGVIAMVDGSPVWPTPGVLRAKEEGFIFALDSLEDPHNVGSLVRSAWGMGCLGVLVTKERSAGSEAPAAQKVASGGFEHVPVLEVPNLHSELMSLKELGFWVYGLDGAEGQDLTSSDLGAKSVLVIGGEDSGLRKPVVGACDALLSIPQNPTSESFNAAIAGAIVGFEFVRQRNVSHSLKNSRKKL